MREQVSKPILLYDGVCGFCDRGVQFLLKRDLKNHLLFASLQSDFAKALLRRHGIDAGELETIYVVLDCGRANEALLARADAVAYLMRVIGGVWNVMRLVKLLPTGTRNRIYDLIAGYRYRIFGKYETCALPEGPDRSKFLDCAFEN
jgi:predicted DCC family thiol-disulfide oxidoreductase YuxK